MLSSRENLCYTLGPARADEIRAQSVGEIIQSELFQPRSVRPVPRGPLCELLFGKERDWECQCGRLRGSENIGYICQRCDQPVVHLRRTRWGHIELPTPVVHPFFQRQLATLLHLEWQTYCLLLANELYLVVNPGPTALRVGQLLNEDELSEVFNIHGRVITYLTGTVAVRFLLERISVRELHRELHCRIHRPGAVPYSPADLGHLRKRLRVVEAILRVAPENPDDWVRRWILDCVPVLPSGLRPHLRQGGTVSSGDLSDFYAMLVNRGIRLRKLVGLNAPEVIVSNEARLLQQDVECLFDNLRARRPQRGERGRRLRTLADRLAGPTRTALAIRRTDYSARAPLTARPGLALDACDLPWCIAVQLLRTQVLVRLANSAAWFAGPAGEVLELLRPRWNGADDEPYRAGLRLYAELLSAQPEAVRTALEAELRERRLVVFLPLASGVVPVGLTAQLTEGPALAVHPRLIEAFAVQVERGVRLHLPLSGEAQHEARMQLHPKVLLAACVAAPAVRKEELPPHGMLAWFGAAQTAHRERLATRVYCNRIRQVQRLLVLALSDVVVRERGCSRPGNLVLCQTQRGVCQRCLREMPCELGTPVGVKSALALIAPLLSASDAEQREAGKLIAWLLTGEQPADSTAESLAKEILAEYRAMGWPVTPAQVVLAVRTIRKKRGRGRIWPSLRRVLYRRQPISSLMLGNPLRNLARMARRGAGEPVDSLPLIVLRGETIPPKRDLTPQPPLRSGEGEP